MVATFTYDTPSNTVTVVDATSAFFDDWVAADIANYGTWGFHTIAKLGTAQYRLFSKLIVGDNSTTTNISDKNKTISWDVNVRLADGQANILVKNNATVTFGVLQDLASKLTSDGCHFFEENTHYGHFIKANIDSLSCVIYLYGCCFNAINRECGFEAQRIWNCHVTNNACYWRANYSSTPQNINNLLGAITFTLLRGVNVNFTINNILAAVNGGYIFYCGASNGIYKNVIASLKAGTYIARLFGIGTFDQYFINVNSNIWAWSWNDTSTGKLYCQYELDVQAVDNQNNGAPLEGVRFQAFKNGVEITQSGSGYISVPNVVIGAPPAGGTQATAHAVLNPNGQGLVSSFVIDNPGSGYVTAPMITVDAPTLGVRATALASLTLGAVSSIIPTTYTDVNGYIPTRYATKGYYNQAHGNVLQDDSPILIVLTKAGYQEYHDEMNINMKTAYQVSMNRVVPVFVGAGGKLQVDLMPTNPVNMMLLDIG